MYALYLYQYCQAETVQVLQYILIHDGSWSLSNEMYTVF